MARPAIRTGRGTITTSPARVLTSLRPDRDAAEHSCARRRLPDGPLYYLSKIKMTDISDGTSNTAIFSEKIRGKARPTPWPT